MNPTEKQQLPLSLGNNTPFETSATIFGVYTPRLEEIVKDLSTGELRRLVNALIQYPLNDKVFIDDTNKKLKEAFRLGNELIRARSIMEFETLIELEKKKQDDKETNNTRNSEISTKI